MNPGELLSMVTGRIARLEKQPTGLPVITPQEVAGALAAATSGSALLLRVKYCGQLDLVQKLDIEMWTEVVNLWSRHDWRHPKYKLGKSFARDMGRLALVENIDPHTCLRCGGSGWITINSKAMRRKRRAKVGKIETCTPCRGTGRKYPTDRARAAVLEMPSSTWSDTWKWRYREIQLIVDRLEEEGLYIVYRQLRRTG